MIQFRRPIASLPVVCYRSSLPMICNLSPRECISPHSTLKQQKWENLIFKIEKNGRILIKKRKKLGIMMHFIRNSWKVGENEFRITNKKKIEDDQRIRNVLSLFKGRIAKELKIEQEKTEKTKTSVYWTLIENKFSRWWRWAGNWFWNQLIYVIHLIAQFRLLTNFVYKRLQYDL